MALIFLKKGDNIIKSLMVKTGDTLDLEKDFSTTPPRSEELMTLKESDLEKLAARADLDTVCAFDYHRMKTFALGSSTTQGKFAGLRYEDFHPEAQGVKVPTL